jgi:hypothetical protein
MSDFLQLFYRGDDRALYSFWDEGNGVWSNKYGPPQRIGGVLNGAPVACQIPGTGVVQLFYRGTDNNVWSVWRNTDGSWSDEQHIGGILNGDPIAVQIPGVDYVIQLFYRGLNNSVYSRWRQQDELWSDEQQIGGILNDDPRAGRIPGVDYVIQLFYQGLNNTLYTRWRNADESWSGEQHLGGVLNKGANPVATGFPGLVDPGVDNVIQVLYQGVGNHFCYQQRDADGSWAVQQDVGGTVLSDPAVAQVPGTDLLRVFYQGLPPTGHTPGLVTRVLDPKIGTWSSEERLGGDYGWAGVPAAVQVPGTQTLQVFYPDSNGGVRSRSLTAGNWSDEQTLGDGYLNSQFALAVIPG